MSGQSLREALEQMCVNAEEFADEIDVQDLRALLAAHPESAAEHGPGTRFVVVEIPPGASDREADEITEKVSAAAHEIDGQYDGSWDLFIYRQHNAPPANVPALPGTGVTEQAVEAAARTYYENLGWDWGELSNGRKDHEESKAEILREFEAVLEAVQPYMGVRPVVDREAVKQALSTELRRQGADDWFRVDEFARDLTASVMDLLTGNEHP